MNLTLKLNVGTKSARAARQPVRFHTGRYG
jgi:hypothetical protein